jgi:hypothetical protein
MYFSSSPRNTRPCSSALLLLLLVASTACRDEQPGDSGLAEPTPSQDGATLLSGQVSDNVASAAIVGTWQCSQASAGLERRCLRWRKFYRPDGTGRACDHTAEFEWNLVGGDPASTLWLGYSSEDGLTSSEERYRAVFSDDLQEVRLVGGLVGGGQLAATWRRVESCEEPPAQ